MPNSWSRRRVRLRWLVRAIALRRCVRCSSAAVRSTNWGDGRWSSHQYGINAARAVCTWHSVNSGFSPPEVLAGAGQEQVADGAERQVPFQSHIAAAFVVVQAYLAFAVLETAFDPPAGEGHQQ